MKHCYRCGLDKPLSAFSENKTKKDGRSADCRECHKAYNAIHYQNHVETYKANAQSRRKKIQRWLRETKKSLACIRCGESHIACLVFHHKDPALKETEVARVAIRGWSIDRIKREIDKCDVLCENCHRKLHYKLGR